MFFQCEVDISAEVFEQFTAWHKKTYPDFKGTIRRSAESLFIAEIIDEDQNLTHFRFMKG